MVVLRELPLILREARARSVDRALRLAQAEERGRVVLVHRFRELVGLGLAPQRLLGDAHQRLVSEHREVIGCHFGNQADLRAAAVLALRQVLLECGGGGAAPRAATGRRPIRGAASGARAIESGAPPPPPPLSPPTP